MKKLIIILGASIILTGCSNPSSNINNDLNIARVEEVQSKEYSKSKDLYINEDMKKVIEDINDLREKHKDILDERGFDSLYIDIYEGNIDMIKNIEINNYNFHSKEYFNDVVEILDSSIAPGLKDFVHDVKDRQSKDYDPSHTIIEKIGRTSVYVQDRGEKENYISIRINFLEIEDEYYREVFNKVSDDKYILDNLIIGEKLNLIDLINIRNVYNDYHAKEIKIRYNMFFQDENMKKVNILLQGKNGVDFKDEDIGVFINLLNQMDLKEEEKDSLVHEYRNVFKANVNKKKMSLENYDLYINYNKGNSYSGRDSELRYFSIKRK